MSRKVILFIAQTLDGYIAEVNGNIDFLTEDFDPDQEYDQMISHIDTVVMGRTTYDQVVNELSPDVYPYVDFQNYILTSRPGDDLDQFDYINFVNDDVVKLVEDLKKQSSDKDIWIVGGGSIVTPLVNANIIDTYQIGIVPVVLGNGIPLFSDKTNHTTLKLTSTKKVGGIAYLEYTK
ncbi:dihydrofolate reductase family protein [Companilactobacillus ginsenosidimutans]|uniref:Dihydrofolate reductase n=1 Tax=Companilactobacillus ginsenosidimutans TaxID=1007676 RepID=A0A0H4QK69_9LACO|nr:dihydrofolate reductase family protein [Companilactobacillus ginsenosidimutans]AKP67431.1 dihydrofolate reductase [Companilactobacillus ginsenosidimutans]